MHYRMWLLDEVSGRIVRVREIDAPDEVSAIALAQKECWRGTVELWQGDRRLLRRNGRTASC